MPAAASAWMQFALCVVLIGAAGVRLIRYGDAIAAATGLSRSWVGLVMVATVTSLPELVTGVSAVTVARAPDLAVGDALGSTTFNLLLLALMGLFCPRGTVAAVTAERQRLPALAGLVLLGSACLVIALDAWTGLPQVASVSAGSGVIIALYLGAMRTLYLQEQGPPAAHGGDGAPALPLRRALGGYALASAVIVAGGLWLPLVGVELARLMGWSDSFVGTLFVALATSVPEVATTWGAMRLGAADMAMANLLGSNLFDVLVLAIDDLAYRDGSLFAAASPVHALSALTACLMTGVVVLALRHPPPGRAGFPGTAARLAMVGLYVLNLVVQYHAGA